jgi:hypothetical protein
MCSRSIPSKQTESKNMPLLTLHLRSMCLRLAAEPSAECQNPRNTSDYGQGQSKYVRSQSETGEYSGGANTRFKHAFHSAAYSAPVEAKASGVKSFCCAINRRASSCAPCIAMLMPSAMRGCDSPAMFPAGKTPFEYSVRIPGLIGPADSHVPSRVAFLKD